MGETTMDMQQVGDVLLTYLRKHFDEISVKEVSSITHAGDHCFSFALVAAGEDYRFNITSEAIAGLDQDAVAMLIENNNVASVMRDLRGFPVTLTNSGCIFGDVI